MGEIDALTLGEMAGRWRKFGVIIIIAMNFIIPEVYRIVASGGFDAEICQVLAPPSAEIGGRMIEDALLGHDLGPRDRSVLALQINAVIQNLYQLK